MQDQFVTFEIVQELKVLNFTDTCLTRYGLTSKRLYLLDLKPFTNTKEEEDLIAAPLWQQVVDWLYNEHGLFFTFQDDTHSEPCPPEVLPSGFRFYITEYGHCVVGLSSSPYYPNPKVAREGAILRAIEFIKTGK